MNETNTIVRAQPLLSMRVKANEPQTTLPDDVAAELELALNGPSLSMPELGRIAARLLVSLPAWLEKEYLPLAQMITDLEQLERGSGRYRAYATYDSSKTLTGFVFRPYYGGVWFPASNEVKIAEFEV